MGIDGISGINSGTQRIWQGENTGGIRRPQAPPQTPQSGGASPAPSPTQDSVTFSPEAQGCIGQGPGDGKPPLGPPEDPFGLGPVSQENKGGGKVDRVPGASGGQTPGPGDGKPPLGPPEDPFGRGPVSQEGRTPQVQTLVNGIKNW